jgi:hypothetical protein
MFRQEEPFKYLLKSLFFLVIAAYLLNLIFKASVARELLAVSDLVKFVCGLGLAIYLIGALPWYFIEVKPKGVPLREAIDGWQMFCFLFYLAGFLGLKLLDLETHFMLVKIWLAVIVSFFILVYFINWLLFLLSAIDNYKKLKRAVRQFDKSQIYLYNVVN